MDWLWSRIDRLLGAAAVAAGALGGSQLHPILTQYIAHAAENLAKAQAHLLAVQTGLKYQVMAESVRGELLTEANQAVAVLKTIHDPVALANMVTKPFVLWRRADPALFDTTLDRLVPALPASGEAIVYTVAGALLGFVLYELLRWPVVVMLTEPPKRRFRRKS
jgi:hypothetical protein